jgi:DNA-binding response OmpR family regulator
MSRPTVIVAHERPAVRQIVGRVLAQEGFDATPAADANAALALLAARPWSALVLDVALPGAAVFDVCDRTITLRSSGAGAQCIVLVASVYRSTSYKRRPTRLYGADDYIEIHHLGDALPAKLRRVLGLEDRTIDMHLDAGEELRVIGDGRMTEHGDAELAKLIVADVVLYNGDRLLGAVDVTTAEQALAQDLAAARELFASVARGTAARQGTPAPGRDAISLAFAELMAALGRAQVVQP